MSKHSTDELYNILFDIYGDEVEEVPDWTPEWQDIKDKTNKAIAAIEAERAKLTKGGE